MPRRAAPLKPLLLMPLLMAMVSLPAGATEPMPNDCTQALSTLKMNACAGADFETADTELNRVYSQALAAIPEMAAEEQPFDKASWEEALRASQRAWIVFRDAECEDHVEKFWGGGTGATADMIGCKTEKTEQRTKELKQRYEIE